MRARTVWLIACLGVMVVGFVLHALSMGQERPNPIVPAVARDATPIPSSAIPKTHTRPGRDLSKLRPLQQQMHLSAQRGGEWLYRMNGSDGRFIQGYVPALKTILDGDHYLRQAGATVALARAARYTGDERYLARARQAVLTLLADTAVDASKPGVRTPLLPPVMANPLAAAGLIVQAVHELPEPAADLLEQSDQLCAFLREQQQADGSLHCGDRPSDPAELQATSCAGEALHGLMRSQQHRPATWKTEVVRKALAYYQPCWRAHKTPAFVPAQSAACTEAYLLTGDKAYADVVFEMNDWLCELQYPLLDPRHPLWGGGFMSVRDGKAVSTAPQIDSACCAEALAEACRVARKAGDLPRYQRYREALERCLQFVNRLQYTEANTQHFADWYRPTLVGGFHASQQDGNLRIDYTQHAICAMLQYVTYLVE